MSNQTPYDSYAPVARPPKRDSTLIIVVILVCGGLFALMFCGILAGLLLPAVNQARTAARKMSDSNNIRQIGLAMMEYEQTYNVLPPAYTVDAAGNRLHSWRTLILPYLDEAALYQQIDFNKPWDAPENAKFHTSMPGIYNTPSTTLPAGETMYRVILHPKGIFTGPNQTTYASITDGAANTILVVQAGKDQSVNWMRPDDYSVSDFMKVNETNSLYYGGVTHIITADSSVQSINVQEVGPKVIESSVIIDDGGHAMPNP